MRQDKFFSQERMNLHKSMREIFADTPESDITAEDKQKALDRLDRMIIEEDAKPRGKYYICIDAHTETEDCVTIYHKTFDENPVSDHTTFYAWLHRNFPLIDWQFDDGDDTDEAENTDYCQYCCYTEEEGKGYILALYQAEEIKQ